MKNLAGIPLPFLPLSGLEKVQDLDRHDGGVLISHFKHPKGSHYIYYWCDCTDSHTRWMLLRVSETDILRLVNQVVPLDLVIPKACLDEFVYFVDVSEGGTPSITMTKLNDVPSEYRPKTVYLQVPDSFHENEYALLIDKPNSSEATSSTNIFVLPKIFSQVYSVIYAMRILKPQKYEEIPWRDGFGGKRFYEWLLRLIPGEDRPEVDAFQFASPGFVKFSLNRQVGDWVSQTLIVMSKNERIIGKCHDRLYEYISSKQLNDLYENKSGGQVDWCPHEQTLTERTKELLQSISSSDEDALFNSATPFESAKIVLSFIRRLRELKKYERDGLVRFPRPQDE